MSYCKNPENPKNPIPKTKLKVIKAYDNHQECETLTELELRQENPHKLHMEGLAIRERILDDQAVITLKGMIQDGLSLTSTSAQEQQESC